jgi:hypothetical protein
VVIVATVDGVRRWPRAPPAALRLGPAIGAARLDGSHDFLADSEPTDTRADHLDHAGRVHARGGDSGVGTRPSSTTLGCLDLIVREL